LPSPFARGGGPTILVITALLAAVISLRAKLPRPIGNLLLLLVLPLWGLVLVFFRDPERLTPAGEELVLSPADGRVVAIEHVNEPLFIQGPAVRVSIFMSIWDVHVNRSPVSGQVKLVRHVPGQFLQAFRPEASDINEHILLGIQARDQRVLVKQIAGILARRCVNYAVVGERLERGQRFGLIRFSSRVDLFLPPDVQLLVQIDDSVRGGSSILAQLPFSQEET
jgi:phosphatidylserine decarboxylase